jgi:hypothetical protein
MQVLTINAYTFDELSDTAQQAVIDRLRNSRYNQEIPWQSEYYDSLKEFCDRFNMEFGYHYDSVFVKKVYSEGYQESITGLRLRTWLLNNVYPLLYTPKSYNKGSKHRVSRISRDITGCQFTGFCADEELMQPIREFIEKPNKLYDLKDLLEDCLHVWNRALENEREYYLSDESIREDLDSLHPDALYTEDGEEI